MKLQKLSDITDLPGYSTTGMNMQPTSPQEPARRTIVPIAILAIACVCVFLPTLRYDFLCGWDDHLYVTDNLSNLQPTAANFARWWRQPVASSFHPLTMYTYMADHAVWGHNALGYRLQNLWWHVCAVIGLYLLSRFVSRSPRLAFWLALLFAVHPQRIESVVWISERKDVLCAAMYVWALLAYVLHRHANTPGFPRLALFLFCLSLLAKAMAITLPLVMLLMEWQLRNRLWRRPSPQVIVTFVALAIVWIPVTMWSQDESIAATIDWGRQWLTAMHNVPWYLSKLALPQELNPLYARVSVEALDIATRLGVWSVLISLYTLWNRHYRGRPVMESLVPLCAYIIALGPVIGIVPIGAIDVADRYSYIPSMMLFVTIAFAPPIRPTMHRVLGIGLGVYLSCLLLYNWQYQQAWRDLYSLWRWAADAPRPNPVAVGSLADLELQRGHDEEVLRLADVLANRNDRGLTAEHIQANQLKADVLRATVYFRAAHWDQAQPLLERVARHRGVHSLQNMVDFAGVCAMLADGYRRSGDVQQALAWYDETIRQDANRYSSYLNRGVFLFDLQRYQEAAADFTAALTIKPDDPIATHNLNQAAAKIQQGVNVQSIGSGNDSGGVRF